MSLRALFGLSSLLLALLTLATFVDEFTASWADHQREYNTLLAEKATDPALKKELVSRWPVFEQIYNPELGVVDRCILCHRGIDNPDMKNASQPHRSHPGNLLESHPQQKYGCTICHQGQGRATDKQAAWGRVSHWEKPLLTGSFVQATCTRCHVSGDVPQAPLISRGRKMLRSLGCVACHQVEGLGGVDPRVAPDLSGIGSKVTRAWLSRWLTRPDSVLPAPKMPDYGLRSGEVEAIAAYLMQQRSPMVDSAPAVPEGDYDRGSLIYKQFQCIDCHVTRFSRNGKPVGGSIGPALVHVATKTNRKWLFAWLRETHRMQPRTLMPHFKLSDQQAADLVEYICEEWYDPDIEDEVLDEPEPAPGEQKKELAAVGMALFANYGCSGCHGIDHGPSPTRIGPELTYIGSKDLHRFDFGKVDIRHTRPDYFFAKVKDPGQFGKGLDVPSHLLSSRELLERIWKGLTPAALFSERTPLPAGKEDDTVTWILDRVKAAGFLKKATMPPPSDEASRPVWLRKTLENSGAFSVLKMPDFGLSDEDSLALTIALMSLTEEGPPSKRYIASPPATQHFDPQGQVGQLFDRYRCLSCHSVWDQGENLAADLSNEGSRVDRNWLYEFLRRPYSMRRTLTIAMPQFHLTEDEARTLADYLWFVTTRDDIPGRLDPPLTATEAEAGKLLFQAKGCQACHQTSTGGGDVGPSLATQVPDFPVGTWAGDKLREGWVATWLKNPHALLPEAREPRLDLTQAEIRALTAFVMSLRWPGPQQKVNP